MSEYATLLKFGTTGIILGMIEEGYRFDHLHFKDSLSVLYAIDKDLDFHKRYEKTSSGVQSPLEVQREYLRFAKGWVRSKNDDDLSDIVDIWEETLDMLDDDDPSLERRLDWKAKLALLNASAGNAQAGNSARSLAGYVFTDASAEQINLQYHDIDTSKGLYYHLVKHGLMDTFLAEEDIQKAISEAPIATRAGTRKAVLDFFRELNKQGIVISATRIHWDSMLYTFEKFGVEHRRYLMLNEPFESTEKSLDDISRTILSVKRPKSAEGKSEEKK
jgi:proteasome accessory factor A